jgi:uroporphyrinogen-III decarboxylase
MKQQFIPWLYATTAHIRQVTLRDMAFDAVTMVAGVIDAAKLFQAPALCLNFNLTLWAEAAGCTTDWDQTPPRVQTGGSPDPNPDTARNSARITTLVDAAKRVKGASPQHPLICAIAGPATMAA